MVFRKLIICGCVSLLVLILNSCEPAYYQDLAIYNNTSDTLFVCLNKNIKDKEWNFGITSGGTVVFGGVDNQTSRKSSLEMIINDNYYSFRVYRHDTCLVHWSGKMQHLGDSIHNFYNYDSWTTVVTGKYSLCSTFTITEDDLRQTVE